MAYDKFTANGVFQDQNINVLCNKILDHLGKEFTEVDLNTKFGLTGTVSKIIQGAPVTPIKCIAFATNDEEVYKYIINNCTNYMS